jgi:RNA polymerase sigma factor (sigma-70 family)
VNTAHSGIAAVGRSRLAAELSRRDELAWICNAALHGGPVFFVTNNEARLEQLWRRHLPAVLNYARRRTGSVDDAHEVAADVFVTAWRLIDTVPEGREARLWLFTVARHAVLNTARTNIRRTRLAERIADELALHPTVGNTVDAQDTTAVQVREALSRLRETDRELLVLVSWDGLTAAEAAQVLDLNPAAVRVRLHRARQRLRVHLQSLGVHAAAGTDPASRNNSTFLASTEMI